MSTETLTGKLRFDGDPAIAGMNRASAAFSGMAASAKTARAGINNLRAGFAGANMVMMGAGVVAAGTVKKYADFADAFGTVKAVLGKEAAGSFDTLESKAKELGATTSFTAIQAANAMENLARAGLEPAEIMSSIAPTLAAAAAEGMDLGTAADIVASNLRIFGLEASNATRVADALAFVSRKTNTNMISLQEGMKFAGPVAAQLGVEIEDTAAALGVLADSGLKGTLGGTALKNSMLKMAKAAKNGKVEFNGYTAAVAMTDKGTLNLSGTMKNVVGTLSTIQDPLKRVAALEKLVGMRGLGAVTAFDRLTASKADLMFGNMRKSAAGTADEMQKMRLDNLKGDFVLLSSAVEGMAISLGSALSSHIRPFIQGGQNLTQFISDSAQLIGRFWGAKGELGRVFVERDAEMQGWSRTAISFSRGLVEGIRGAVSIFKTFGGVLAGIGRFFGGLFGSPTAIMGSNGPAIGGFTSLAIKAGALALSLKVTVSLFARLGRVAAGTFQIMKGALGMAKGAVGGTVKLLSAKFPALARALPAGLGKLAGAVNTAEKISANPVRIVNWDEAGMLGAGGMGGKTSLGPYGGTTEAVTDTSTRMSRLGKAARIAGGGIGVLAAAMAGWQIGRAIDEAFGVSEKLANFGHRVTGLKSHLQNVQQLKYKLSEQAIIQGKGAGSAQQVAQQMLKFHQQGIQLQQRDKDGIKKVAVTRAVAEAQIRKRFAGQSGEEMTIILKSVENILRQLPDDMRKMPPPQVVLKIDEKEVGRAAGTSAVNDKGRGKREAGPAHRTSARR